MARRPAASKKKTTRTASFEGVGKGFAAEQEYLVEVKECTVEDGEAAPYYSLKLEGTGEFVGSVMYHNASLAAGALWRTRDVFEAFLGEVPEGDFDVDEYAELFVGKRAMCSTYKDTYNGQSRIKPEDFWPAEGAAAAAEDLEPEVDLDALSDDDIKRLGKELGIKSKRVAGIKEELGEADFDDVADALRKLGLLDESEDEEVEEEEEAEDGIDLDALSDDDIKALAKAAGIKGTMVKKLKAALAELSAEDLAEAAEEAGIGGEKTEVSADAIAEMSQEELEQLVEEHELDVDLDDHKTLRKKRSAVVDACIEAGLIDEE